jgi:hypothetical protein
MLTVSILTKYIDTKSAIDFNPGETFYDGDGDLYIRCTSGCIRLEEGGLTPYTESHMDTYPYFKNSVAACQDVVINVRSQQ